MKYIVALLVILAFTFSPITVTFERAYSMPALPADAEQVNQQVFAMCESGPLLRYTYKLKSGDFWVVFKQPNRDAVALLKYKAKGHQGVLEEMYVGKSKFKTAEEAMAAYPSPCSMLEPHT